MMIVYSLLSGPVGFSELMRRVNINTTTLAQRLLLLEHAGLLTKTIHSTMPPRTSYTLTGAGLALQPLLDGITAWSEHHLPPLENPGVCPGAEVACDNEAA